MENKNGDGALFLIIKGNQYYKVKAFLGVPIELNDLTSVNSEEDSFLQENRSGFILTGVKEKSASIKLLFNKKVSDLIDVNFNERKTINIAGIDLFIELWAVRLDPDLVNKWNTF